MSVFSDVAERLRAVLLRGRAEHELDDELRDHLEREVADRVRRGADPAEARREALAAFGGVERIKDDVREARGVQPLEELLADVRFAARALRHNIGFTVAVVTVLGLGIGATATVFTVVDKVLLADLPYPHADRLVRVVEQNSPTNIWALSTTDYLAIRDQQRTLDAFGVVQRGQAALSGTGTPQNVPLGRATSGFFAALGVTLEYGRLIQDSDEPVGAPAVVIVSHSFAEQSLGGASVAVGKTITLDGVSHTVIGVLPPGVNSLAGVPAGLWAGLQPKPPTRRGPFWLRGIGRMREGVTLDDAALDLAGISRRLLPLSSDWTDASALLTPGLLRDSMVSRAKSPVTLFAIAVALVLLVAIANVATLLLVRATARQHELSVRAALGASRQRIGRLVMTECALLVGLAGLAGLGVAAFALRGVALVAPNLPRLGEVVLDLRVAAFVVAATLLSGILVSISPVAAVLAGSESASKPADRRSGASRRTNMVRGALVVSEFALALPLLLGAGLLLNSFLRLQRVNPGFDPEGLVAVTVAPPGSRYPDFPSAQLFFQRLEQRVAETGVPVGLTSSLPPDNGGGTNNFNLVDHPVPTGTSEPVSPWMAVTASYFTTLGVPLLDGRLFTAADSSNGPPVVVVSRSWAEHYYPRESAVGKQLVSGGCYDCPRTTIIGVVGDVKYAGLTNPGEAVYDPITQSNERGLSVVVRTRVSAGEAFRNLRTIVGSLDPEMAVEETTLQDQLDTSLADPKRWTTVLSSFAAAASLLAALGIFGLMSFVVRQRRREMGVRLALGADPRALTRLVVGRGMRYALIGTAIGLGLSVLEARWLRGLLFGVEAMDPLTVTLAAGALLLTALLACWIPGLRAARVRPVEVLASE